MSEVLQSQGNGKLDSPAFSVGMQNLTPMYWMSIVICNHNSGDQLLNCIRTLEKQDYPSYEVVVVDNKSNDGSIEKSEKELPWVKVIKSSHNGGFGYANNLGARNAIGDIFIFLNPDTEVSSGWLESLASYYHQNPQASLIASKIVMMSNEQIINSAGNQIHFTGLSFCRGLGDSNDHYQNPDWDGSVSGAGFAIRRDIFEEIGGFDPILFLYHDDVDISLRCHLAGYRCLYAPKWVVKHDFIFELPPEKWYFVERNRLIVLLKIFRWRTLLLLFPCLLMVEGLTWGYLAFQGQKFISAKFQSYVWVIKHFKEILQSREKTQSHRRVRDNQLLRSLAVWIPLHQLLIGFPGDVLDKAVNGILNGILKIVIPFIKW